jgi:urease accessory protein
LQASGWFAQLDVELRRCGARTVLERRAQCGPLVVQRPFHESTGACQVYVLHPPGGLVAGDKLEVNVVTKVGAQGLLTTPGASKIYRSLGEFAGQTCRLELEQGSELEWLPQEAILFDGARLRSQTHVELARDARFLGWDILCLGRDEAGFRSGRCVQSWMVERAGRPLWGERLVLSEGAPVLREPWGLNGRTVMGTLVATNASREHATALRALQPEAGAVSVTLLGEVLIVRYLGWKSRQARAYLEAVWRELRMVLFSRAAEPPRVWAT